MVAMSDRFLVLNGPNLNLLGTREPALYGTWSLAAIEAEGHRLAETIGWEGLWFQSNHEGALLDAIHQRGPGVQALIINGGALSHSSYALRDALAWYGGRAHARALVEVHLSHVFARESFRRRSVLSPVCTALISGLGAWSYFLAIRSLARFSSGRTGETTAEAGDRNTSENASERKTDVSGPQPA